MQIFPNITINIQTMITRNIGTREGKPSYLNLNFQTNGLDDLLRSETKRNLPPAETIERGRGRGKSWGRGSLKPGFGWSKDD